MNNGGFLDNTDFTNTYYTQTIEQLQQENQQLKDNWNKLKEYIEKAYNNGERIDTKEMLDKIKEIERGVSDDKIN